MNIRDEALSRLENFSNNNLGKYERIEILILAQKTETIPAYYQSILVTEL